MFPVFYLLGIVFLVVPTARLPLIELSPSDVFIFAAFAWLLMEAILPRREKRALIPIHVLWVPAILILVGGSLASLQAVSPFASLWATAKVWFVLAPWVSMGIVMVRRGYLKHILYAVVIAGGVSATVAVLDQVAGLKWGARISGVDVNYWTRMTGTFGHPSTLGYFTCVAFPVAFGLFLDEWQNKRRAYLCILLGIATLVLAAAMFNSGSVTAWLGSIIAFGSLGAVWLLGAQKWMRWSLLMLGLVVLLLGVGMVALDLVPGNVASVIEVNLDRASERTGPGRLLLLGNALAAIDENPLIGVGMDQTGTGGLDRELTRTAVPVHNTIISGWLNGGVLTFVGLVVSYLIALVTAVRGLTFRTGQRNWIVLTLSAATLAWIVFDQTQPQLSQRFTWMTVSLLFGLGFGIQLVPAQQVPISPGALPTAPTRLFPEKREKAGAGK